MIARRISIEHGIIVDQAPITIAQQFDIMGLNCNLNFTSGETRLNHDKFTKFISNKKIVIEQFKKLKKNKSNSGIFKIYKEILNLNKNEKF